MGCAWEFDSGVGVVVAVSHFKRRISASRARVSVTSSFSVNVTNMINNVSSQYTFLFGSSRVTSHGLWWIPTRAKAVPWQRGR